MPAALFLILCFCCMVPSARGAGQGTDFAGANQLYEKGDYKGAIRAYQELISRDPKSASPNILFNLGNACFKNAQPGWAIAYYRQAAALAPRDPDIQANLRYARDSITTTFQEPPYHRLLTWFRLDEITFVVVLFWWVLLLLIAARLLVQAKEGGSLSRIRITPGVIKAVLICFVFSSLFLAWAFSYQRRSIAVLVRETAVRYGPLEESQTAFTLREGAEMPVLDQRKGWVQIGDAARQGWAPVRFVVITR